jgi:RimJ/RimL family protein N-acetyltransferase
MTDSSTEPAIAASGYFLRTPRLGFRTWTEADLDLALGLWGDAEVTRLIGGAFSREKVQQRLAHEIANQATYGIQYWPMFLLINHDHAGCCGLRPYGSEPHVYELGFHLRRMYWGQGLAVEAGRAVIAYAFERRGAASLFAGHHPDNAASRRVLLKLGFRYTHDEFYPPTGLHHPSYRLGSENY